MAAGGLAGVAALGGAAYAVAPARVDRLLGLEAEPFIPTAPEGLVRLETVFSKARGQDVDLFTCVPEGHGDGEGLPVVVVLHGSSARAEDFRGFGLPRFLTQAVRDGAEPFVLAGADGGLSGWEPNLSSSDDPQAMVVEEMPAWMNQRGFDGRRRGLWGWSMGGYGALRLAEGFGGWARAVAAFSPAVSSGDAVFADVDALSGLPLGVWCGTEDSFYDAVRELVTRLPQAPEVAGFSAGRHTRVFWNDQTLAAFDLLASHL